MKTGWSRKGLCEARPRSPGWENPTLGCVNWHGLLLPSSKLGRSHLPLGRGGWRWTPTPTLGSVSQDARSLSMMLGGCVRSGVLTARGPPFPPLIAATLPMSARPRARAMFVSVRSQRRAHRRSWSLKQRSRDILGGSGSIIWAEGQPRGRIGPIQPRVAFLPASRFRDRNSSGQDMGLSGLDACRLLRDNPNASLPVRIR